MEEPTSCYTVYCRNGVHGINGSHSRGDFLIQSMDVQHPEPATIFEDNQACIVLARTVNTRSKHIDIKYTFNREKGKSGEVAVP